MLAAPYPTPKLVKLRQPEAFRSVYEHDGRVRHVYANFDYGRSYQHVYLTRLDAVHHLLLFE